MTPTPGQPLSEADVSLLTKLIDTLKPFAEVADAFRQCHVVEICAPTPDNPSRQIMPMPREWFERAADDLEAVAIQLHHRGVLSEGQASKITGLDRVEVRKLADAYRPHAPVSCPGDGVEGEVLMAQDTSEGSKSLWSIGSWLSAALDDPNVCEAMKADIRDWFGEGGHVRATSWPEVTADWAETYCELTGKDPDGQQVTFVDGGTVTTFRDMARREIEAMLCAAPKAAVRAIAALTPPAEPVSRPAGEGEREAVARLMVDRTGVGTLGLSYDSSMAVARDLAAEIIALLSPAAPDAGGGSLGPLGKEPDSALKIATDLHAAYEQLIYGLPKYLDAENLTDEENMIREAYITLDVTAHRLAALTPPAEPVSRPAGEGEATDNLVDRFAEALKAKLRAAGEKYGFGDAWKHDDWREKLIEDLWRHVQKGDPRDVAAYCAFAWYHGWSLSLGEPMGPIFFSDQNAEARYVGKGEREAVARLMVDRTGVGTLGLSYDSSMAVARDLAAEIIALLRPAAPDAGGGDTLKADFVRSHPSGFDDCTYEQIEDALDRADAPITGPGGKFLTLAQRVSALQPGGER